MVKATFPDWMVQIQKLDVQDGDILWVKVKDHIRLSDVTRAMAKASDDIYRVSGKRFVILVTSDDTDITVQNPEDFCRNALNRLNTFPGLDSLMSAGYVDADSGISCEALPSTLDSTPPSA